jgi:hypothetical protein
MLPYDPPETTPSELLCELAFNIQHPSPNCPQWKKSPARRLYAEITEVLGHINNHMVPVEPTNGDEVEHLPHPYDIRYLQGLFAMQFMRAGTADDKPMVWATRGSRQTRDLGTYFAVNIRVAWPAPPEGVLTGAPVLQLPRAQKIASSKEYLEYPDQFFSCFLSFGASTRIRNSGDIIIIRAYMKFFTEVCKNRSGETVNSDASRCKILEMELVEGVCLRDFFNSASKGVEYLRNVGKKYSINGLHLGDSTIAGLIDRVKSTQGSSVWKIKVMMAALRGVNIGRWDEMVASSKHVVIPPPESPMYLSVEILVGNSAETTAMDKSISLNRFKNSVMATETTRGKVVASDDQHGTLESGVLTCAFLTKLKELRTSWVKNRRIWFSTERTEGEASRAHAALGILLLNYSNKQESENVHLQNCKRYK